MLVSKPRFSCRDDYLLKDVMPLHGTILDDVRQFIPVVVSPIITWLLAQTTQNSGRDLYIAPEGASSSFDGAMALESTSGDA